MGNLSFCEQSVVPDSNQSPASIVTNPQKGSGKSLASSDPVGWWGGVSHNLY